VSQEVNHSCEKDTSNAQEAASKGLKQNAVIHDETEEDNNNIQNSIKDVISSPQNEPLSEPSVPPGEDSGWETVTKPRDTLRRRRVFIEDTVSCSPSLDLSSQPSNSEVVLRTQVSSGGTVSSTLSLDSCCQSTGHEIVCNWTSSDKNEDTAKVVYSQTAVRSKITNQETSGCSRLRPIVIDGSNVAMAHGVHDKFSVKGIEIVVDHFKKLGHDPVVAMLPRYKSNPNQTDSDSRMNLLRMEKQKTVVFTPSRTVKGVHINSYDDRMILDFAVTTGAIVVSNDNFMDLYEESETYREVIKQRILMTTFVGDYLMFPKDPLGKDGPRLGEFLRF